MPVASIGETKKHTLPLTRLIEGHSKSAQQPSFRSLKFIGSWFSGLITSVTWAKSATALLFRYFFCHISLNTDR